MRRILLTAGLGLLIALLGNSYAQEQAGNVRADDKPCSKTLLVTSKSFQYNDGKPVEIEPGDSVVWVNNDRMPHSATRSEGSDDFNTGILQSGDKSEPIIFLRESGPDGFSYGCIVHEGMQGKVIVKKRPSSTTPETKPGQSHSMADMSGCEQNQTPSVHSMVVTGRNSNSLFLHHISLFNDSNHVFHVTLEARLDDAAAQDAYRQYRKDHEDSLCIIDPELFLLPEIQSGKRTSFKATFSDDKSKSQIPGLTDVKVTITRIIQFRRYDPADVYPDRLTYQIYGNDKEVFLAHQVTAAPSFQEVVKLKDVPPYLTPEIIKSNPLLVMPTKRLASSGAKVVRTAVLSNSTHLLLGPPTGTLNPQEPLKENEELEVLIAGDPTPRKLTIGKLIYFDVRILNK
jgi:plastocyanin